MSNENGLIFGVLCGFGLRLRATGTLPLPSVMWFGEICGLGIVDVCRNCSFAAQKRHWKNRKNAVGHCVKTTDMIPFAARAEMCTFPLNKGCVKKECKK